MGRCYTRCVSCRGRYKCALCPSCVMQVEGQVRAMPVICHAGAGKVRAQVLRSSYDAGAGKGRAQVLRPLYVMQVQVKYGHRCYAHRMSCRCR